MFETDPVLMQKLAELVASNGTLGLFFPFVLQLVTGRFTDTTHKKNAAWITCFVVSMILAAIIGAFAPVMATFQAQGAVAGLIAFGKVLFAAFGALLMVSGLMYDKWVQPIIKTVNGEPEQRSTVKTLLEDKILEQTGVTTDVKIKGLDKAQGYINAANQISELFTNKKDKPKAPANPAPGAFDLAEGQPEFDPEPPR